MKYLVLLFLLISPLVHADSGWTDYGAVIELAPDSDYRYRVKISASENPSGCKKPQWYYQDYLSTGSNQMFSALLEALIHGLKVKVYVNGKCGLKGGSEITAVNVRPE